VPDIALFFTSTSAVLSSLPATVAKTPAPVVVLARTHVRPDRYLDGGTGQDASSQRRSGVPVDGLARRKRAV
jgi:hypothetical protein